MMRALERLLWVLVVESLHSYQNKDPKYSFHGNKHQEERSGGAFEFEEEVHLNLSQRAEGFSFTIWFKEAIT